MQHLAEEFEYQAEWRREKAAEYPDDKRNHEAAEILDQLARSVRDCPAETIEAVFELCIDGGEDWSEMKRQVGFSYFPKTAEEFCNDFIQARMRDELPTADKLH